jgi:hypothetical protein
MAPMPLSTYSDAAVGPIDQAQGRGATCRRGMDKTVGNQKFANDRSLTDQRSTSFRDGSMPGPQGIARSSEAQDLAE